jgi:hypothetical protein
MICLIGVSFVWNATTYFVQRTLGPPTFTGNREAVVARVTELVEQVNTTRAGMAQTHEKMTQVLAFNPSKSSVLRGDSFDDLEEVSPNKLIEVVDMLIEEGQLATKLHEQLLNSIQAYSGVLPEAKLVCHEAAEHQRKLADAERYAELKDTYLAAARYFDALAERISRSAGDIAQPEAEVTENAKYVGRAIVFLQLFREDLEKVPEFPGPEMHAELLRAIQRFVADFERFRAALDGFGQAIPGELPRVALPAGSSTT